RDARGRYRPPGLIQHTAVLNVPQALLSSPDGPAVTSRRMPAVSWQLRADEPKTEPRVHATRRSTRSTQRNSTHDTRDDKRRDFCPDFRGKIGGSAWESNPARLRKPVRRPVLKTGRATGPPFAS